MWTVAHLHHHTPSDRLVEIETEVFQAVDRMCLVVGALLHEARTLDRAGFVGWVETRMPFGIDKADRLIAIHLAYGALPPEMLVNMPRPWQALYALRAHVGGRLDEAIASGEVGPDTTVKEARERSRAWGSHSKTKISLTARYKPVDKAAGALMTHSAADLDDNVRRALLRWLQEPANGSAPVDVPHRS